jgi:hypothetical protein
MQNVRATKRAIQESEASADAVIGAFISNEHLRILCSITLSRPLIILFMNVPTSDFLRDIQKPQTVLVNYSYQPASAEAAATVLFENPVTPGILPVKAEPPQSAAITANVNN